jgi:hypothetical protein
MINKGLLFVCVQRIAHQAALWRILAENGKPGNPPRAILTASEASAQISANHNRRTEVEMFTNRFINLLIVIALVALAGLTVREVSATSAVITVDQSHTGSVKEEECASLPPHASIHSVYLKESGTWLPYTEDGPTGFDGGLIYLLSNYRTCSK